jgi:hypothetical protein
MTNSLQESSLDSLYDLLDFLREPLETSRNEGTRKNRLYAPSFSALGYFDNNETKQTEIIGSLLDPKGKHGQGTLFLRHFLMIAWPLTSADDWPEDDLQQASIYPEHYIDCADESGKTHRRIDLWIQIERSHILAVESKAKDAPDHPGQVEAYLEYMKQYQVPYKLLYLSCDSDKLSPDSTSISKDRWNDAVQKGVAESHRYPDFARKWLDKCKEQCEADRIKFFIEDLKAFLDSSDERLTMPHNEIIPEISALLKYPSADKARRGTLLSIWELSDHILLEIMRTFQAKLCSSLLENGMLIDSDGDLADENWGWVVARIAPVENGVPFVAVQRNPDLTRLTVGINIEGMKKGSSRFKQWQEAARSSRLGKGTRDSGWIWQEIPKGFENMRSRDAALRLLDPKTADEVAIKMKDRLIAFEECRKTPLSIQ